MAFVVAGLVWEVEEEVCYGIAVVIEEGCEVGDWSLNRVVVGVDAEGVIAGVALGRRGFGLPASMGLGSASEQSARESETYLFWLCVSDIKGFSTGHHRCMGVRNLLLTQEAHLDCSRCCRPF